MYRAVQNEHLESTEPIEKAFCRLKQALTTERVVKIVQLASRIIFETYASLIARGAVLKQLNAEDKTKYPVGFFSKAHTGP